MKKRKPPSNLRSAKNKYRVAGVGWYTEENWVAIKNSSVDPERFESTYAEWCGMAAQALVDLESAGILGQPLYVDANELLEWCRTNSKPNDGASRAMFVSEKIRHSSEK